MTPASQYSFYIETLGCPKNKVDSRKMRVSLLQSGFRETRQPEQADFIIINSCAFTREAQEETIQTVFENISVKKENVKVVLAGCFSERFPGAVSEEIPEVDLQFGTGRFDQIPSLLAGKFGIELLSHDAGYWQNQLLEEDIHPYAYLRIAQGCSRSCSFCVIPAIRGPLLPYSLQNLEKQYQEEKSLRFRQGTGMKEVILVSQDTISQGVQEIEDMVAHLSDKDELRWVRLHYLFPDRRVLKLLDLFEKYPKLVSYLDIPFQHISGRILESMNRPSDLGLFSEIVQKALALRPDLEVRSAFILGYPGETEDDLDEIRRFMEKNRLHKLSLFRYSHEEGTPAANQLQDSIDDAEKIRRINEMRDFHLTLRQPWRQALVGKTEQVMVESVQPNEVIARREQDSPEIDEVVFLPADQSLQPGDFISVRLSTPMEYDWLAERV